MRHSIEARKVKKYKKFLIASINERLNEIYTRQEFDHCEIDTVIS